MSISNINSNNPLKVNSTANSVIQRNKILEPGFFSSLYQGLIKRPLTQLRYYSLSQEENPSEYLRQISDAAKAGLKKAKERDVKPIDLNLHTELENILKTQVDAKQAAIQTAVEAGQIADLGRLLPDPQVTRVPPLQAHVDAINWQEKTNTHKAQLSKKISVYCTLLQMRDSSGIKVTDPDKDSLDLMNLVKTATEGEEKTTSVWNLFNAHYHQMTFFQMLKAAWVYLFYFQTTLISNTVDAYLGKFIENISRDLSNKNSPMRTLLIRSVLENTNQFLISNNRAYKNFANETEFGDLKDYHNRAIEAHYGSSLSELCRLFAEKRVEKDSPIVPIFKKFQTLPLIGRIFERFEWFVNHFIIQKAMKSSILPEALKTVVEKGLKATRPDNMPFTLSIVQFLTQRLEQLQNQINESIDTSPKTEDQLQGTELLPEAIKNLIYALKLESVQTKTPLELKQKIQEIEEPKNWFRKITQWDNDNIEKKIEQGIIDAGDLLFRHLNETAKSGELFATLLECSLVPFSGNVKTQEQVHAEYEDELAKLERTAELVFHQLIRKSVSKVLNGTPTKDTHQIAHDSFESKQKIAEHSVNKLSEICRQMAQKIERSLADPKDENNVKTDIATLFSILQIISGRKELQEELKNIEAVDQNAIWRILNPIFKQMAEIEKRLATLQDLQDSYPAHTAAAVHLKEMKEVLQSIREKSHTQPRHLDTHLIESMEKIAQEITNCLGPKAGLQAALKDFLNEISYLCKKIATEQKAIDAIYALYPPRYSIQEENPEGFLDQLLNYERGVHPNGFKPQACLAEIEKQLIYFPAEEKRELQLLIGNGSNLKIKWRQLGEVLQRIYTSHMRNKNQSNNRLDEIANEAESWLGDKVIKYQYIKNKDHQKMSEEMSQICREVEALRQATSKLQLNLPAALPPKAKNFFSYFYPIGGALTPFILSPLVPSLVTSLTASYLPTAISENLRPSFSAIGAAIGGMYGKYKRGDSANHDKPTTKKSEWPVIFDAPYQTAKKSIPSILAAIGTSYLVPAWASHPINTLAITTSGGYVGSTGVKNTRFLAEEKAYHQVMEIFNNAKKLIIKDPYARVYKAAATRTMKAMIEAD